MPNFNLGKQYGDNIEGMAKAQVYAAQAAGQQMSNRQVQSDALREQVFREAQALEGDFTSFSGPGGRVEALINSNPELANRIAASYYNSPQGRTSMANRNNGQRLTGHGGFKQNENGKWVSQFTKQPTELGWADKLQNLGNYITGEDQIVPATLYQTDKAEDTVLENSLYNWTNPMLHNMGISDSAFQQRLAANNKLSTVSDGTNPAAIPTDVYNQNQNMNVSGFDLSIDKLSRGRIDPAVQNQLTTSGASTFGAVEDTKQAEFAAQAASYKAVGAAAKAQGVLEKASMDASADIIKSAHSDLTDRNKVLTEEATSLDASIQNATMEFQEKNSTLFTEAQAEYVKDVNATELGSEARNTALANQIRSITQALEKQERYKAKWGANRFNSDLIATLEDRAAQAKTAYEANTLAALKNAGLFQTNEGSGDWSFLGGLGDIYDRSAQGMGVLDSAAKAIGLRDTEQAKFLPNTGFHSRVVKTPGGEYKYFRTNKDALEYQDKISEGEDIGLDFLSGGTFVSLKEGGTPVLLGKQNDYKNIVPYGYTTSIADQEEKFKDIRARHKGFNLDLPQGITDPTRDVELQGVNWAVQNMEGNMGTSHDKRRAAVKALKQADIDASVRNDKAIEKAEQLAVEEAKTAERVSKMTPNKRMEFYNNQKNKENRQRRMHLMRLSNTQ